MFITAVCVIFLIELRWPKSLCDNAFNFITTRGKGSSGNFELCVYFVVTPSLQKLTQGKYMYGLDFL